MPIEENFSKIFDEGEWAGDAEISMIPLVYDNIKVAYY